VSDLDLSVAGDDDRWMLLERVSAENLSLIVRSRINPTVTSFAAAHGVVAVICDVLPQHVRDDGFPSCLDDLHALEDTIIATIANSGVPAFHTASATGDGRRVLYVAADTDLDLAAILSTIPSDVALLSEFSDLDFDVYQDFVSPTKLDTQFNGDRGVMASLAEQGDDGAIPRKIDFWLYGERQGLDQAVKRLLGVGFAVDHWLEDPFGVVLTIESSADMTSFRDLTPLLLETAEEFGVVYDGWETFVVGAEVSRPPTSAKPSLWGRLLGQKKN